MLAIEHVGPDAIRDCIALSEEADWNQTAGDWAFIIAEGECYGLRQDGRLIASAAVVTYGAAVGWICMMLVAREERRQGHASRLMRHCMERLEALDLAGGLDATPAGREVYQKLGFADVYGITRLRAERLGILGSIEPAVDIAPMSPSVLGPVAHYDRTAFGADRTKLLVSLHRRLPRVAQIATGPVGIRGFVLGREGRLALQIGPIVADSEAIAVALAAAALGTVEEHKVIIDVPDHHARLAGWLRSCGFADLRPLMRMRLPRPLPGDTSHVLAITGPEFS